MTLGSQTTLVEICLASVDVLIPVGLGLLASIGNVRHHVSRKSETRFWAVVGSYLAILLLLTLGYINLIVHPEPEGLAAFSLLVTVGFLAIPGSIIPAALSVALFLSFDARAFLNWGLDVWYCFGCIAWQFFFVSGIRWLATFAPAAHAAGSTGDVGGRPTLSAGHIRKVGIV